MDRRPVARCATGRHLALRPIGEPRTLCFDCSMAVREQMIEVFDFEDPRLTAYQNLKDARLANRHGRFIVEGRTNIEVLLSTSDLRPESILLSERAERSFAERLDELGPKCPIYVAQQSVLDRVVGFPIHRGCLAVCVRPKAVDPLELAVRMISAERAPRLLVLEGLRNHDNVGGIFRNAMALGGKGVILCPKSCDPLYRKAIRTSMGGTLCVPFARATSWPGTLGSLRDRGYEVLALDPGEGGIELDRLEVDSEPVFDRPVALVLGTEGEGLSLEAIACADRRIRIGMESGVDSLNVAVASGIALHALRIADSDRRSTKSRYGAE
jgi:tRNA G18 (ribose-2'-O)-methylase SpoU